MAYVNTGTKRSLTFTFTKTIGGSTVIGYPKTYDGRLSWGNFLYPAITDEQMRQLTDAQYSARKLAFLSYVESLEAGFDSGTDFTNVSEVTDETACPPPPTTTTTSTSTTSTTSTTVAATTTTTVPVTTTTTTAP